MAYERAQEFETAIRELERTGAGKERGRLPQHGQIPAIRSMVSGIYHRRQTEARQQHPMRSAKYAHGNSRAQVIPLFSGKLPGFAPQPGANGLKLPTALQTFDRQFCRLDKRSVIRHSYSTMRSIANIAAQAPVMNDCRITPAAYPTYETMSSLTVSV
jgi:hypothetical protein